MTLLRGRRRDRAARAAQRLKAVLPEARVGGWVPARPSDPVALTTPSESAGRPRAGRHRHRIEVDGWAAAVVLIVLGGGLLVGLAVLLRAWPHEVSVPMTGGAPSAVQTGPWAPVASTMSATSPSAGPSVVLVHIAGLVRRPGVVTLTPGARVADAVAAAGGATSRGDLGTVNLARPVVDGEQVVVRESGAPPPSLGRSGGEAGGRLDLNAADQQALEALPGVGPVLAGRILEWRTTHGRFSSVDELREVSGIGEKVFASLADRVRV